MSGMRGRQDAARSSDLGRAGGESCSLVPTARAASGVGAACSGLAHWLREPGVGVALASAGPAVQGGPLCRPPSLLKEAGTGPTPWPPQPPRLRPCAPSSPPPGTVIQFNEEKDTLPQETCWGDAGSLLAACELGAVT